MSKLALNYSNIQSLYPNEWVLIGNPVIDNANVLEGQVIHHNKDKRDVCDYAKSVIDQFDMIKIIYTGQMPKVSRLGIFKVIESK